MAFYTELACRGDAVQGEAISSAEDAALGDQFSGHKNPLKAFDGVTWRGGEDGWWNFGDDFFGMILGIS